MSIPPLTLRICPVIYAETPIDVVTDAYEAPPIYKKPHENVKSFYNIHYESEAPLLRLVERSAHWTPHSGRVDE